MSTNHGHTRLKMQMNQLKIVRNKIDREVFDYQVLLDALSGYSKPRDRITKLLASGELIRIKKGLYCFAEAFRKSPISREYLANLIFGPSYISLDYALSFHGLIPERVETITSVTTQRSCTFETPFGHFSYQTMREERYSVGAVLETSSPPAFLIASAEKALTDKVWCDKRFKGRSLSEVDAYLCEDLRIERSSLRILDVSRLHAIARAYASAKINNLVEYLTRELPQHA